MCYQDGISKLTKINATTVSSTLKELAKRGMAEYVSGEKTSKYWYSLKGDKIPGWFACEISKQQAHRTPEQKKQASSINIIDI